MVELVEIGVAAPSDDRAGCCGLFRGSGSVEADHDLSGGDLFYALPPCEQVSAVVRG